MSKNTRLVIGGVLGALALVLLLQNSETVSLTFIAWELGMPLFLVLLIALAIGFALGWFLRRRR